MCEKNAGKDSKKACDNKKEFFKVEMEVEKVNSYDKNKETI
ncbi:hypothetical protein [Tuanshanicoccus lijuaniae]